MTVCAYVYTYLYACYDVRNVVSLNIYSIDNLCSFVCKSFVSVQVSVVRPPNYTLLMIWIPVLVLALIVGYLKRENLHALYEPRYWAVAAMVY